MESSRWRPWSMALRKFDLTLKCHVTWTSFNSIRYISSRSPPCPHSRIRRTCRSAALRCTRLANVFGSIRFSLSSLSPRFGAPYTSTPAPGRAPATPTVSSRPVVLYAPRRTPPHQSRMLNCITSSKPSSRQTTTSSEQFTGSRAQSRFRRCTTLYRRYSP